MERATAMTLTFDLQFLVEQFMPDAHIYNVNTRPRHASAVVATARADAGE